MSEIIGDSPADQVDPRWHIRVRALTKSFGTNLVLDKVDLDLERHKVNVILGASGAGKSVSSTSCTFATGQRPYLGGWHRRVGLAPSSGRSARKSASCSKVRRFSTR
jgi:ABC-type hemin transport system ATPase subunit